MANMDIAVCTIAVLSAFAFLYFAVWAWREAKRVEDFYK